MQVQSLCVAAVGSLVIVRFQRWEDFQEVAHKADLVAFMRSQSEGTFEVDAYKDSVIFVYIGEIPSIELLLRLWLSKKLEISDNRVFEGIVSNA